MRPEARIPDGRGGPHVYVADLDDPILEDIDRHHLSRVLRLAKGDPLTISDGRGGWRSCRFDIDLEITGDVVEVPTPAIEVTVGFSLIKGGQPDLVVRKLTEVGVDRIVPLLSTRSIVRWDPKKARDHQSRFLRVCREAGMQSRRVRLPQVEELIDVEKVSIARGVSMAEPGGGSLALSHPMVLVGPEGGWTEEELGNCKRCSLGTTILRSETAAVVAGALLVALRDRRLHSNAH